MSIFNNRSSLNFSIDDLKIWLINEGFKINDLSERSMYVYRSEHPNAKVSVYYSEDGIDLDSSIRKYRRKNTIIDKIIEAVNLKINAEKRRVIRLDNKERLLKAIEPFNIDTKSSKNTFTGLTSGASMIIRLNITDYFKALYGENTYSFDELKVTLKEVKGEINTKLEISTDNADVLKIIPEFVEKIKENFWACGI